MRVKNMVILHGWGANTSKFEPLASSLKKLGWKVFVPEIPGFGAPDPKIAWDLDDYAKHMAKLSFDKFKGRNYYVFGHSFGGGIAIKMATHNNDLLEGLVLCSTRGFSRGSIVKRAVFYVLAKVGKVFLFVPPVARFWEKVLYIFAREHDYEKTSGVMKEVFQNVVSENLKLVISVINLPKLVLWGEEDMMTPIADARYINNHADDVTMVTYPNISHNLPYVKFDDIAKEIEKWTK